MAEFFLPLQMPANAASKIRKLRKNPLDELTDAEIYRRYRFDRAGINFLLETFRNDIEKEYKKGGSISADIQLLCTIHYLAENGFQLHIGDTYGICQKSVSNIVSQVCKAISRRAHEFIKFPRTENEIRATMSGFYSVAHFPSVVGLVDGTHIEIQVFIEFCTIKFYKVNFINFIQLIL
jgi:nuclease HARBI1